MIELVRYGSMEVVDAKTGARSQQHFLEVTNGDVVVSLYVPEADYYRLMGIGGTLPPPPPVDSAPQHSSGVEVLPFEAEPDDGVPSI